MRSWTFGCTESSKARRVVIIVPRFLVGFGLSALCSLIVVGLSTGDPSLAGTITPKPPQWVDFNASNFPAEVRAIAFAEVEELLSRPTTERIGRTFGTISWDGIGPTLYP